MIWTVLTLFSVLSPCTCFSSLCPNCTGLPLRDLPGLSMLHPATGPLNMLLSWLGMHLLHFVWSAYTYHSHPNLFFFKKDIYDFLDLSALRSLHCPIPLCVSLLCLSHGCVAGEGGSSQLARTVAGWKVLSSGWGGQDFAFPLCPHTLSLGRNSLSFRKHQAAAFTYDSTPFCTYCSLTMFYTFPTWC